MCARFTFDDILTFLYCNLFSPISVLSSSFGSFHFLSFALHQSIAFLSQFRSKMERNREYRCVPISLPIMNNGVKYNFEFDNTISGHLRYVIEEETNSQLVPDFHVNAFNYLFSRESLFWERQKKMLLKERGFAKP